MLVSEVSCADLARGHGVPPREALAASCQGRTGFMCQHSCMFVGAGAAQNLLIDLAVLLQKQCHKKSHQPVPSAFSLAVHRAICKFSAAAGLQLRSPMLLG